jgi:Tfp pilus assembly protein PilZ
MSEKRRKERSEIKVWANNNTDEEIALWLGAEYIKNTNFKFCYSTKDISESGIFLETKTPLSIGSMVDLDFRFPDTDKNVAIKGKVVRVVTNSINDGMGIEFVDLEEKYKVLINKFIEKD